MANMIDNPRTRLMKELMTIRVILPDGSVQELQQGDVRASDLIDNLLLNKHFNYTQQNFINPNYIQIIPNYFKSSKVLSCDSIELEKTSNPNLNIWWVCKSSSLRVGRRPCPLAPAARLQAGHLYYVLPIRAFMCSLTRSHVSVLLSAATAALLRSLLMETESRPAAAVHNLSQIQQLLQKYELPLIVDNYSCSCSALKPSRRRYSKRVSATTAHELHSFCAAYINSSGPFNVLAGIQCKDARDLHIEQLIKRNMSWRPCLETVRDSRAY